MFGGGLLVLCYDFLPILHIISHFVQYTAVIMMRLFLNVATGRCVDLLMCTNRLKHYVWTVTVLH